MLNIFFEFQIPNSKFPILNYLYPMFKNKNLPFLLFTFSVIMVLIVSQLIQDGMFMDGEFYTCVGKNLADGLGTFWNPHLSKTYMYSFHVQPPLYFGLLAVFYKVLGSSMYVERLFCFVFFVGAAIYIHKIWKKMYADKNAVVGVITNNGLVSKLSWLPVLFWVTIPVCFWAYTNHVMEVVMSFFAIASVYHIFIALNNNENVIFNLIVAGVFIFLSSLTKGAQGLFPVVGAGAFWLVSQKISFKKMFFYSTILVAVPAIIYGFLLITNKEVYDSFYNYFQIRYTRVFNNLESTTDNRFDIIIQLFMELLPMLLFTVLFFAVVGVFTNNKQNQEKTKRNLIFWFLLIGLSGSLPLMVTLEQRNFYLVTSLPYFAIAIAMFSGNKIATFINKINIYSRGFKIAIISCSLLLVTTFIYSATRIGECKRDADSISDVYQFGKIIPHGEIVRVPSAMNEDWNTRYYLLRYFYINMDVAPKEYKYFIIRKNLPKELVPLNYGAYAMGTKYFDLYILKNEIKQ